MQNFLQTGVHKFEADKVTTIDLKTDYFQSSGYLVFDYKVDNQGGAAPTGARNFARIANLIREIKITINDNDDIMRLSGLELMAIYMADHGRAPSTMPFVFDDEEYTRAVMPINHWTTNSNIIQLTGHDFRLVDKAVMEITWSNIGSLFHNPQDCTIDLNVSYTQQAVHAYVSPVNVKRPGTNARGRPRRLNPMVRHFYRSQEKFASNVVDVELGRIERGPNAMCKGFIMYSELLGNVDANAFHGDITLTQGNKTLSRVPVDVLIASHEVNKGQEVSGQIIYFPFSGLFQCDEFENMSAWKDDIIIRGNFNNLGSLETNCNVLADAYRDERLN